MLKAHRKLLDDASKNDDGTDDEKETSKDCPSENREEGTDDTVCGDCLSDFTDDGAGVCVADTEDDTEPVKTNWMLYGGVAVVAVLLLS